MQLLEDDASKRFSVWFRWGRGERLSHHQRAARRFNSTNQWFLFLVFVQWGKLVKAVWQNVLQT